MSNEEMVEHLRNKYLEPDPDPDPVCYCDYCGAPMYEGERIWTFGDDRICDDCAEAQFSEILRED